MKRIKFIHHTHLGRVAGLEPESGLALFRAMCWCRWKSAPKPYFDAQEDGKMHEQAMDLKAKDRL